MKQLGATVLTKEANPQALDAKVKQQVPQWAELFRRRASSSNKPRDPRKPPQERGF